MPNISPVLSFDMICCLDEVADMEFDDCSAERSLQEYKDKVPQTVADAINTAIADVRGSLESDNAEEIKSKTNALQQAVMKIGESMAGGQDQQQPPSDQQAGGSDEGKDDKEKTGGS